MEETEPAPQSRGRSDSRQQTADSRQQTADILISRPTLSTTLKIGQPVPGVRNFGPSVTLQIIAVLSTRIEIFSKPSSTVFRRL